MSIIYEPRGKAKEYSELAVNLYRGCSHACTYCYCPAITRQQLADWSKDPAPRADILRKLEKEAAKMRGDQREILFSFMADPYMSPEAGALTRDALLILEKYNLRAQVLTKGGKYARKDFDILVRNGWKFGSTIIFMNERLRETWEPKAPTVASRVKALIEAHEMGIFTWVSLEPVVDHRQALAVIEMLKPYVDFWKVGKLNHNKTHEATISWGSFLDDVECALAGHDYYIKEDLEKHRLKKRASA